jgi:hypothetical protein
MIHWVWIPVGMLGAIAITLAVSVYRLRDLGKYK